MELKDKIKGFTGQAAGKVKSSFSSNGSSGKNSLTSDPKAKTILATGITLSSVLLVLLGGLAAVLYSLKDIHLLVELKKNSQSKL